MQKFVKQLVQPVETVEGKLLVLKRFERLRLDCLCLDRRYLDVFVRFQVEIENLKDTYIWTTRPEALILITFLIFRYNEQRASPPIPRCMPPSSGRLVWLRSLQRRIVDPMDVLKTKQCVITHHDAQLSVKLYNFLMEMFLHHEMQLHKGWFDFAEEIRRNLSVRVLRKNVHTNWLEINFHPSIYQLIREGECILKLGLG